MSEITNPKELKRQLEKIADCLIEDGEYYRDIEDALDEICHDVLGVELSDLKAALEAERAPCPECSGK